MDKCLKRSDHIYKSGGGNRNALAYLPWYDGIFEIQLSLKVQPTIKSQTQTSACTHEVT